MSLVGSLLRRRLLAPFVFFSVMLTAILWALEGVQLIQTLLARGRPLLLLQALVYSLPTVLTAVLPIAVACSALVVCARLHEDGENAALQATGIVPWRLAQPFVQLGMLSAVLLLLLQVWIVPVAATRLRQAMADLQPQEMVALLREGDLVALTPNVIVSAHAILPNGELLGLFAEDTRDPERHMLYSAQRAAFKRTTQGTRLFLERGTVQIVAPPDNAKPWPPNVDSVQFDRFVYDPNNADLQPEAPRKLREMTFAELTRPPTDTPPALRRRFIARAHEQVSTALYPLVFAVVVAALGLAPQPARFSAMKRLVLATFGLLLVRMGGIVLQNSAVHTHWALWLTYMWPVCVILLAIYVLKEAKWRYLP